MNDVRCTVTETISRTADVVSVRFNPENSVAFEAGQFLQVVFDEEDRKNKELNKFLSFSCAPDVGYLEFTKKLTGSTFSEKIRSLVAGDSLLIKCPMGRCVFNPEHKKLLFLAGGIGITPVISIVEHIVRTGFQTDIILVYANKTKADIAFHEELNSWSAKYPALQLVHALEEGEVGGNISHIGFINDSLIRKSISDYMEREMYVFGPPAMVNAMKKVQEALECDPSHVHSESFMGY